MTLTLDPQLNKTLPGIATVTGAAATLLKSTSFTSDRMVANYLYISVAPTNQSDGSPSDVYHYYIGDIAGQLAVGRQNGKDVLLSAGVLMSEDDEFTLPFQARAGRMPYFPHSPPDWRYPQCLTKEGLSRCWLCDACPRPVVRGVGHARVPALGVARWCSK